MQIGIGRKRNTNAMNTKNYLNSKPVRFSSEIEGEGAELLMRGLLMICLLSALVMCNLGIGTGHRDQPAPSNGEAVALVKSINDTNAKL